MRRATKAWLRAATCCQQKLTAWRRRVLYARICKRVRRQRRKRRQRSKNRTICLRKDSSNIWRQPAWTSGMTPFSSLRKHRRRPAGEPRLAESALAPYNSDLPTIWCALRRGHGCQAAAWRDENSWRARRHGGAYARVSSALAQNLALAAAAISLYY
jgi:hypothetical protein